MFNVNQPVGFADFGPAEVNKLDDNVQSLSKKPDVQMSDLLLKVRYALWMMLSSTF